MIVEFSLAAFLHLLPLPAAVRPAPGHYFVSLAGDVRPEEAEPLAAALVDQYHGVLEIVYLRGFRAAMSESEAVELSRDPRVALVARTDELSRQPPTEGLLIWPSDVRQSPERLHSSGAGGRSPEATRRNVGKTRSW